MTSAGRPRCPNVSTLYSVATAFLARHSYLQVENAAVSDVPQHD
jgi:hypothetical protein